MKTAAGNLGATPQATLIGAQAQLATAQQLWNQVIANVASKGPGDPCQYHGDTSQAATLQQISTMCCTIAHQAALAALGFAVQCGDANGSAGHALSATQATTAACTMSYECTFGEVSGDAVGTVTLDVNGGSVSCLDTTYRNCVGAQLQAAQTAVSEAQLAQAACLQRPAPVVFNPQPGPIYAPPRTPSPPVFIPRGFPVLRSRLGAAATHPGVAPSGGSPKAAPPAPAAPGVPGAPAAPLATTVAAAAAPPVASSNNSTMWAVLGIGAILAAAVSWDLYRTAHGRNPYKRSGRR